MVAAISILAEAAAGTIGPSTKMPFTLSAAVSLATSVPAQGLAFKQACSRNAAGDSPVVEEQRGVHACVQQHAECLILISRLRWQRACRHPRLRAPCLSRARPC